MGDTDLDSAARLAAEGSVLIDLRPAAAFGVDHLPGAIHSTDVSAWAGLLQGRHCWVLLYGGTLTTCRRFARKLPDGAPVLTVRATGPRGRILTP